MPLSGKSLKIRGLMCILYISESSRIYRIVDLLINEMTKANVSHQMQNKLLKVLAPNSDDMLYK